MPSKDKRLVAENLKAWRIANPDKYRAQMERAKARRVARPLTEEQRGKKAIQMRRLRARKRALVNAAKSGPCADCGRKFPPYVMDLHHINGDGHKMPYKIAGLQLSVPVLQAEISKCVAICANCHRMRHHGVAGQLRLVA